MSSTSPTSARRRPTSKTGTSRVADERSRSGSRRGSSRRVAVRRVLRKLHAWVGLALSVLLFMFGITGSALVYKEAYWRSVYPELRAPAPDLDAAEQAAAISAARREFGPNLRSVKLPEPGVPAYHLYLNDGEAFLSIGDHRVIDEWRPRDRPMGLLFDLHAHLMGGETGERVGGFIGLLGALLSITGLILWWPTRRLFRLQNILPRGFSRSALVAWHRDLGLLTTPIVLLLVLTGSSLVFYSTAGVLLNGMFGDPAITAITPPPTVGPPVALAEEETLARVREEFPEGRLVFYYAPHEGVGYNEFRLKQPCELHPNGRSFLYLGAAGQVLQKTDACALPPGERALHAMYPLHAGKANNATYKFLTLLGGFALAALSVGGGLSYLQQLRSLTRHGA
ncbi:MAG: hypothetical protein GEU90_17570 [Gemmatimonas sp.]|nr:hypothetical protein [Gemmatimonas sp.]